MQNIRKDITIPLYWVSLLLPLTMSYQSNIYLKANYAASFSSEIRVALSLVPGFIAGIIMFIFRGFIAGVALGALYFSIVGLVLYLLWKIVFYFLA